MAYGAQFRKKLLSVKETEGLTNEEVAKRFGVSKGSVLRWKHDPDPVFKRNRPAQKLDMGALAKDVEENPDSYHYERAIKFNVTESGIRAALKRLNISRKKSLKHPKADEIKREAFGEKIENHKQAGKAIVYLDESIFAKDMPRTHGYAKVSERCYGRHDWQAKGRTNVIVALLGAALLTVTLFEFPINADIFIAGLLTVCYLVYLKAR